METETGRRRFLGGALSGVVAGGVSGFFGARLQAKRERASAAQAGHGAGTVQASTASATFPHASFAQQGEDLIIRSMLEPFGIARPTYLDIGAHDPIRSNNTYLLYATGSRGVLVEPNPALTTTLQTSRPGDRVLAIGIGVTAATEADYYVIRGDGQLNTFAKDQADWLVKQKGPSMLERVIKVPLVNVNDVIKESFDIAPNVLSVDTEGLDFAILQSLDFARYRPHVICAETLDGATGKPEANILELLASKGYSVRGATFVNTLFLANELLAGPAAGRRPAATGG